MAYAKIDGIQTWRPEITGEALLEAGYKFFDNVPFERNKPTYQGSYQKAFDDERGRRYFITFTCHHMLWSGSDHLSMEADAYYKRDGVDFKIETLQTFNSTLDQIETLASDIWTCLRCDYYERDDGGDERQDAEQSA